MTVLYMFTLPPKLLCLICLFKLQLMTLIKSVTECRQQWIPGFHIVFDCSEQDRSTLMTTYKPNKQSRHDQHTTKPFELPVGKQERTTQRMIYCEMQHESIFFRFFVRNRTTIDRDPYNGPKSNVNILIKSQCRTFYLIALVMFAIYATVYEVF